MDDESNKRQRTDTSSNNELHINDLSDGLLVGIASYLAKPSVALFAIAMKPNNSHPTQTSRAIISSTSWNVLDFSDVEKSLASKLSDNDIDKILRSIDAVNNLKILKLAGRLYQHYGMRIKCFTFISCNTTDRYEFSREA